MVPTMYDPPHACYNYGLCKSNPYPTISTLYCPSGNCWCQNGTTGPLCEQLIDSCTSIGCPTTGEYDCTNTITGPVCTCAPGFTGSDCAMPTSSPCAENPCQNGGTCNSPDNATYTCSCTSTYMQPNCSYKDPCTPSPCYNGGTCQPLWDGQEYLCKCTDNWFGARCGAFILGWKPNSTVIDGCFLYDPVLESGSKYKKIFDKDMTYSMCQNLLETQYNNPPYTMFTVQGKNCYLSKTSFLNSSATFGMDKCDDNCPGDNKQDCGGTLTVIQSTHNQYYTKPQNCTASMCQNLTGHGMCVSMDWYASNPLGYICLCKYPWTASAAQTSCITPTPCSPNPCQHGGLCIEKSDLTGYTCDCSSTSGYVGDTCQFPATCDPNPCMYGSTCLDNLDGTYDCLCLPQYTGTFCENINTCTYADPCVNGTCLNNGTQIQVFPWCQCDYGFSGDKCDIVRNLCEELNNPCEYNGTCTAGFMAYNCTCIPGTTGPNCSTVIDNCVPYYDPVTQKTYPTRCNIKDNAAQCINSINNFSCNCSSQWTEYYCDLNVIIRDVMITIYGRMDATMLPLLNNLLQTPAMISDMVPFIIGTLTPEERANMSWSSEEMFIWATYEEKELDLKRDFVQWNDVVLGNCFTFNHYDAKQLYTIRSSEQQGGLKVRLKVNQYEYEPWTDTAAILTFIHFKQDYVMSESVRYNAEPNNHVIFFPYLNYYTRLGGQYGTCVKDKSEVKNFYFPGDYTTDGCLRSCYQDMVLIACDCMDPRYPMAVGVPSCDVANMTCIDEAAQEKGDPSTWEECVCPLPCSNTDYGVTWSKGSFRAAPTPCLTPTATDYTVDTNCTAKQADSVIVTVMLPKVTYSLFAETPSMDFNALIGNLGALLGVLMGICAITFIEIGVMIFRVSTSILCKPEQSKPKKNSEEISSRGGEKEL